MKLLLVQVRSGIGDMILAGLPYIHALSKKFNTKKIPGKANKKIITLDKKNVLNFNFL